MKVIVICKKDEGMNNHVVTGSEREATRFALIGIGLVGLAGGAAERRLRKAKHKIFY